MTEHDYRDLIYEVRTEVYAQIVDKSTGEVIAKGSEEDMKELYQTLRKRLKDEFLFKLYGGKSESFRIPPKK